MSFAYSQFGTGFSVAQPPALALRFAAFAARRGDEVALTNRFLRGVEGGVPQYNETTWDIRAFVEEKAARADTTAGEIQRGSAVFHAALWLPIKPGDLLRVRDAVYQVETVTPERACLRVEADRRLKA